MKNIIKFVLRLAVAAAIVVGIIFGVSYLIQPKFDAAKITKAESEYNIVEKLEKSYIGFEKNSVMNLSLAEIIPDFPSQYSADTKNTTLPASKKVSDILSVYYQYYLSLSGYIRSADNNYQGSVLNQMEKLNNQLDKTIEYLEFANAYARSKTLYLQNYSDDPVFFARADKYVESYQKQTSLLIKLVEDMRKYVCKTNYKSNAADFRYAGEVKLEVLKDYAKTLFLDELNGKLKEMGVGPMLSDSSETSFTKTYEKFIAKVVNTTKPNIKSLFADSNKQAELRMFQTYGELKSTLLYNKNFDKTGTTQEILRAGFYQLSNAYSENQYKKTEYFFKYNSGLSSQQESDYLRRFVDKYYGEDIQAGTADYYRAQYQHIALNAIYNFLLEASL